MSSVKQLIEFLQTLPPEAEVSVTCKKAGRDYHPDYTESETLCLKPEYSFEGIEGKSSKHIEISDCTTNQFMKPENRKVYVHIGGEE